MSAATEPGRECPFCPRLVAFRHEARAAHPDWHNAPVPSFGRADGRLLIVGLAPGFKGANRTGRPFTGDYAGDLLYATLIKYGFARGRYGASPDDGLELVDCALTNAVRCVPPQNKPTPAEIASCRGFLAATIAGMRRLEAILALGRIAHESVLRALGARQAAFAFRHGARHEVATPRPLAVVDSYHCSRYNTNTGVLTTPMFEALVASLRAGSQRPA